MCPPEELTTAETEYFDSAGEVEAPSDTEPPTDPPAEPAPQPEQQSPEPEPEPVPEEGGERLETVPFHALHKERKEAQASIARANEERDQLRISNARMEERYGALAERQRQFEAAAQAKSAEDAEPPLSYEEDPGAYLKAQAEATKRRLDGFEQNEARQRQAQERQASQVRVMAHYQKVAADYAKTEPSFMDAYHHLIASETRSLNSIGIMDPADISNRIQNSEIQLVTNAFRLKQNPAEHIYNMAIARGFVPKVAAKTEGEVVLEAAVAGQAAASPLAGGGGIAPTKAKTWAQISEMSNKDFIEETKGDKWKKMMNG